MKYFLDTEFDPPTQTLLSIALVSETGAYVYAETTDSLLARKPRYTKWVQEHVFPNLTINGIKSKSTIRGSIVELLAENAEIWAWNGANDIVLLHSLWDYNFESLPPNMPHWHYELKQYALAKGVDYKTIPNKPTTHNALDDARWNLFAYRYINEM